ncbi:stress responsive A/B Barrel domain-containing protein [Colletotrichum asianum]
MPFVHIVLMKFKPDCSPAEIENYGFTHSTKIEFENADDCAYFIKEDPAHKVLFPMFHSLTEEILVMDYTPGCLDV